MPYRVMLYFPYGLNPLLRNMLPFFGWLPGQQIHTSETSGCLEGGPHTRMPRRPVRNGLRDLDPQPHEAGAKPRSLDGVLVM